MNFFDRLRNGWQLGMESLRVLRTDKKLLVFPLLSGLACLLVMLSFALPLMNSPWANAVQNGQNPNDPLVYVVLFAFYFANYFVIVFFNSALVACAIIRFNGGEPTLGDGLGAAMARLPQIAGWSLVSATVGLILRAIESMDDRVGRFIAGILGMAWSVLTYFVVPVLVVEKVGPIQAFKRSAGIIRQTWGEAVAGRFGIGLIMFLLFLLALVPLIIGAVVGGPALWIGLVLTLVLVIIMALVSAAAQVIITAALYQYATDRGAPRQFDERLLEGAFGAK
jgi:hypothetical protein